MYTMALSMKHVLSEKLRIVVDLFFSTSIYVNIYRSVTRWHKAGTRESGNVGEQKNQR